MPFTLAYGSFEPGARVYVVPMPSLDVDETVPVAGRVIAEGVADAYGAVSLPLDKVGEGPSDQMGSSLLRCRVVTGPFGKRVVVHVRRTLAIETGSFPTVPWDQPATRMAAQHDEPEVAAVPASREPTVTHSPHTVTFPPEGPQSEGRRIIAPRRVPTAESGPLQPDHQPTAMSGSSVLAPHAEPPRPFYGVEGPNATRDRIIREPDRTPTWQSSVEVLRECGPPKGTAPPPAYHGHPAPTP